MTFPVPVPKAARKLTFRENADRELRRLVLAEADEAAKFRRRMHLHLCLLAVAGVFTLLSVFSVMDATAVVGTTFTLNSAQEYLDYMGRF
jgi:hypothetical protein